MAPKIFLIFVLFCAFFSSVVPNTMAADAMDMRRYEKVRITKVITRGDHSYIKFAPRTVSSENDEVLETEILEVRGKFETDHPELLVTGWQVHSVVFRSSYGAIECAMYHGIWVDHKPSGKTKPEPKYEFFPPNKQ